MQYLPAFEIIERLTDRCHSLSRLQSNLANQVLNGGPSVAQHPEFIRDLLRVQEQRPRCEALVAQLHAAGPDGNALPLLANEMMHLTARIAHHLSIIRSEPASLVGRLAKESVELILELQSDLERMIDNARQPA